MTRSVDAIWDLVAQAHTFTLPLVLVDATCRSSVAGGVPVNHLSHMRRLADAGTHDVVTPNVDTLYSSAFLDLSEGPLLFHKPASDRFLTGQVMDAYTNTPALLGTGVDGQGSRDYLLCGPGWEGGVPHGATRLDVPTEMAWLLVRTIVLDAADPSDLRQVHDLQDAMELRVPGTCSAAGALEAGGVGADEAPLASVLRMGPAEYFARANDLMVRNPPAPGDQPHLEALAQIGVGPGLPFDVGVLGVDAMERWDRLIGDLHRFCDVAVGRYQRKDGAWMFYGEPMARFGTEYEYRAAIALNALGANPLSAAVYPRADTDDAGVPLDGSARYVVRFAPGQLPPTRERGFWSLTAYNDDRFLIPNPLGRHVLNDRSGLVAGEDGSVELLLSQDPPGDPARMANWLPLGGRPFYMHLRVYLPERSVTDGTWPVPTVTRVG